MVATIYNTSLLVGKKWYLSWCKSWCKKRDGGKEGTRLGFLCGCMTNLVHTTGYDNSSIVGPRSYISVTLMPLVNKTNKQTNIWRDVLHMFIAAPMKCETGPSGLHNLNCGCALSSGSHLDRHMGVDGWRCIGTVLYCTVQYSTVQCWGGGVLVQCCIVQYSTVQYSTVQYSAGVGVYWYSAVLYCVCVYISLYCTVMYCPVLYYITLYCFVLYCPVLYCTVLYCIIMYCPVLYCTVMYCPVLYCSVLYCIVL